ncbi:IS4 family transposase [Salinibacter ruber]|uniref:IS4 family transposase n=1 Tax=Salinibacter ruber TaxID=146919 RepID=UPI0020746C25|nr:IS4 family transposase [Salinibacter ruber]
MSTATSRRLGTSGSIRAEFRAADFGDKRLTNRLQQIGQALGSAPAESIPNACENWASVKGTYRFCDNESVDPKEVLSAHEQAQRLRLTGVGELLLISDTTHLTFPSHPSKEGLGEVGTDEMDLEGVKVHSTIGVLPTTGQMTGILDQQALLEDREKGRVYDSNGRGKPTGLESEREKWIRGDRRASSGLPEGVRPIFVHDRGADAFPVFRKLRSGIADGGFVVRANQNRCIRTADGQEARLLDWSKTLPGKGRTRIRIQQGGDRESREAVLSVKSGTCELLPPKNDPSEKDPVEVNVVRIEEIGEEEDPGQEGPVQWVLLTTEPTDDFKKALTVIDYYRTRWRIEEWHKALKTGCQVEDRQLQTWERMEVLLSIFSVIAWKVLQLRHLARGKHVPPDFFLTDAERAVLKEKYPELGSEGSGDWGIAIAKIGGYLDRSSDPPPGWQTLWKGLKKVQTWAEGYRIRAS